MTAVASRAGSTCRVLLIAGTHSGVGKTTITAGIIAALARRGLRVQPFKVGPDYIDPSYHTLAARGGNREGEGPVCRNLDTWMLAPEAAASLFTRAVAGKDAAIIEGVMGLYDGFGYQGESGSTAQVAKLLGVPVLAVIDASSMARSAAAVALGYRVFDPELPLAGFVVNRVAGERHGSGVAGAIEAATGLPVLGWIPRQEDLSIPGRHLGLVPTAEAGNWACFLEAVAATVERYLDLDALLALARPASVQREGFPLRAPVVAGDRPLIAVARDESFSFIYPENLELLQALGAEVAFFSPLHDESLPVGTRGVILSGGFPELYAAALSGNKNLHSALHRAFTRDIPIYAECGGLMYLTEEIVDLEGRAYPMVGLIPGLSFMTARLTMGYRQATAATDSWLWRRGDAVRGHEFHYSTWQASEGCGISPAYYLLPRNGQGTPTPEGMALGSLLASYVHLHFLSREGIAERFVEACRHAPTL